MNDVFGDGAFAFPDRELVFEWRPPHQHHQKSPAQLAMVWVISGLVVLAVAVSFWQLLLLWNSFMSSSEYAARWRALTWHDFVGSFLTKLDLVAAVQLLLGPVVPVVFLWAQHRQRGSRLYLSSSELRHCSGLPLWLGNLLKQNWTLSLDDFRSGTAAFTLAGLAQGHSPLAMHFLRWKAPESQAHGLTRWPQQLAPVNWFLIGQSAREPLKMPEGYFWRNLNPWTTPEGKAILQRAFDQLPLVAALRTQGVPLPPFSSARHPGLGDGGVDLMAHPRMKAVVLAFFGLLAGAALAFHFTRHQHYFEPPPLSLWAAFGGCCSLGAWLWQTAEKVPTQPSFKPTQGLVAMLFGLAAALVAPFALLGANQALLPAQSVAATVRHAPLQLQPDDSSIPAFAPRHPAPDDGAPRPVWNLAIRLQAAAAGGACLLRQTLKRGEKLSTSLQQG